MFFCVKVRNIRPKVVSSGIDKVEAFVYNKLATAEDLNTKAVERMVSLLRTNGGR